MFTTVAQVLSIWVAAAAVAALSVGATLGALSAQPTPVPDRERGGNQACETDGCHAGCGAGR